MCVIRGLKAQTVVSLINSISPTCELKTAQAMGHTIWRRQNVIVKGCSRDLTVKQVTTNLLTGCDAFG